MARHLLRAAWAPRPSDAPPLSAGQKCRAWWQACRPPFFITAAIPVTLALALAFRVQGHVTPGQWGVWLLLLLGCFLGLTSPTSPMTFSTIFSAWTKAKTSAAQG